eukprot:14816869-Alexandrium_andersonii.AAC.1
MFDSDSSLVEGSRQKAQGYRCNNIGATTQATAGHLWKLLIPASCSSLLLPADPPERSTGAVSYTHLTLPTICSV